GGPPPVTAVGGAVDFVGPVEVTKATHLVHAGDVHIAGDRVAGDLDVADGGCAGINLSPVGPSETVVSSVVDEDAAEGGAAGGSEVVIGHVHSAKERGRR